MVFRFVVHFHLSGCFVTLKMEHIKWCGSRRINECVFSTWNPKSAYLLGVFKGGANFQDDGSGFAFSSTDLQEIIKIQILLDSNHRIWFDHKIKSRYKNGSARFQLHIRNQLLINDLRTKGFPIAFHKGSAKLLAPIPEHLPSELLSHFIRGFIDERSSIFKSRGLTTLKIHYASKPFLLFLSNLFTDLLGLPARTIHKAKGKESYSVKYTGYRQVGAIFKYLYFFNEVPGLYRTKTYINFCKALGYEEDYENLDIELDLQSLVLLHQFCTQNRADPHVYINNNMEKFLTLCRERNLLPVDSEEIIESGKELALRFGYGDETTQWASVLKPFISQ